MSSRVKKTAAVVVLGLMSAGTVTACAPTAQALRCVASPSVARPAQGDAETIAVKTTPGASVLVLASYPTANEYRRAVANGAGLAKLVYDIDRAPIGRRVPVTVLVAKHGTSAGCATSFLPAVVKVTPAPPPAPTPASTPSPYPQSVLCEDEIFAPSQESLVEGELSAPPTHAVQITVEGPSCTTARAFAVLATRAVPGGQPILHDPTFACVASRSAAGLGQHYDCQGTPGTISFDWVQFPKIACGDRPPNVLTLQAANADCVAANAVADYVNSSPVSTGTFMAGAYTCANPHAGSSFRCYTSDMLEAVFFSVPVANS